MTKLYVGQIPAICNEERLHCLFDPFGTVLDITIMRDKATGRSKGSAWVVYRDASSAEDAVAELNERHSMPPQSNPLQIKYAGRHGEESAQPAATPPVHVATPPMNPQLMPDFNGMFAGGSPPQSQVQQPPAASPQGASAAPGSPHHGYYDQNAAQSIQYDPNANLLGSPQQAGAAAPPQTPSPMMSPHWHPQHTPSNDIPQDAAGSPNKRAAKFPPCGGRKLFVGQLPKDMTKEGVREMMSAYGAIEGLHVMTDKKTGQGTGAAFVIFENRTDAQRAIMTLNGNMTVPGMKSPMQVRYAEGEVDKTLDGKLFVGQVPYAATEEDLRKLFSRFGALTEVALVRKGGQSKGCGFVRFIDRKCAGNAIEALNGWHTMPGGHSPLMVRFADNEEEKKRRRETRNHMSQNQGLQNMIGQMGPQGPMPHTPPYPQLGGFVGHGITPVNLGLQPTMMPQMQMPFIGYNLQ